jgi:uncharacterized protein (TIGR02246 family)
MMVPTPDMSRDAILSLYTNVLEAWNRRDAAAYAALFTDTASVVGFDGSQMNGRREIASELGEIFKSHATATYVAKVREIRTITPQTAFLRAVVGMVPRGEAELNPTVNAVQSLIAVPEADAIKIALLHNTPAAFHGRPQLAEALTQELSELVRNGRLVDAG